VPRVTLHLLPVGSTDIPRADAEIARTIATLKTAQFEQDPLFDVGDSFKYSLMGSAVKREGKILEAAVMDAIAQHGHLRLIDVNRHLKRVPDVQFELLERGWMVALEIKRGSFHDAKSLRGFRRDLEDIPIILQQASLSLFPPECVHFHIVFVGGVPRLKEGMTPEGLANLYGLRTRSHIMAARQRYSSAIKMVLRERGL
jgi:hypothetical protein